MHTLCNNCNRKRSDFLARFVLLLGFYFDLQVCLHTTLLPHIKTDAHLREHRFNLHVIWNSDPVRLREALDAVLGDACKEQRLQLGGTLAKDQSLAEDTLAFIKAAFITGQKRCN